MLRPPPTSTLFPYTTLFRSHVATPIRGRRSTQGTHLGRCAASARQDRRRSAQGHPGSSHHPVIRRLRSEEHTSELQSLAYLVCRLLLEKKKKQHQCNIPRD